MKSRQSFILMIASVAIFPLVACSSSGKLDVEYAEDYAKHEPLQVQGFPSVGSLRTIQEAIWRIADADSKGLESLATSDSEKPVQRQTASNWITAFKKGAQGKVTADFYGSGVDRQAVVLYFHKTKQIKAISVRLDGNGGGDGWRIKMAEPNPEQASELPDWVPDEPRPVTGVPNG
ncbi:hypothetical protein OS965_39715 [Streptomyces sp. H27-G5]|uniref:hypothetical protein n=1 Tax=Streptomyces sp. H27-G5 TaxID=2996698 RepID=UPI00226E1DD8|nr:hypothetical protein [Streptomyces sp. H27-G5]MCY0924170.1 hypothetical protein [Streptomyces sp. H27-G5]